MSNVIEIQKMHYFPKWAWRMACQRNPSKYSLTNPMYQGKRVVLT